MKHAKKGWKDLSGLTGLKEIKKSRLTKGKESNEIMSKTMSKIMSKKMTGHTICVNIGKIFICILLFSASSLANAHEHWVSVDNYFPEKNAAIAVTIGSGHEFPSSNFALKDKVMLSTKLYSGTEESEFVSRREDKSRSAKLTLGDKGIYIVTFQLKRPRGKKAIYMGKTIINCKDAVFSPGQYKLASGLEIVPLDSLVGVKAGGLLKLEVLLNGRRVAATCSVCIDGKKNYYSSPDDKNCISLKIKRSGLYLLMASHKGVGCSLTFRVQ